MKLEYDQDHVPSLGERWTAFRFKAFTRLASILLYECQWVLIAAKQGENHMAHMHAANCGPHSVCLVEAAHSVLRDRFARPGFKIMSPQELLQRFGNSNAEEVAAMLRCDPAFTPEEKREIADFLDIADGKPNPNSPWGKSA